jgi:hypothetical protein
MVSRGLAVAEGANFTVRLKLRGYSPRTLTDYTAGLYAYPRKQSEKTGPQRPGR